MEKQKSISQCLVLWFDMHVHRYRDIVTTTVSHTTQCISNITNRACAKTLQGKTHICYNTLTWQYTKAQPKHGRGIAGHNWAIYLARTPRAQRRHLSLAELRERKHKHVEADQKRRPNAHKAMDNDLHTVGLPISRTALEIVIACATALNLPARRHYQRTHTGTQLRTPQPQRQPEAKHQHPPPSPPPTTTTTTPPTNPSDSGQ